VRQIIGMLTSSQLRAARAMLSLSLDEVAAASGLSPEIIADAEAAAGSAASDIAARLQGLFEAQGVLFLAAGDGGSGPGLRLRDKHEDEGIRPQNLNAANDD
jgi:transcriptional regulator with XRE-family HTH domain